MKNLHLAHLNNQFEFEIAQEKRLVNMPPGLKPKGAAQRPQQLSPKETTRLTTEKGKLEAFQKTETKRLNTSKFIKNSAFNEFKKTPWGKKAMQAFWNDGDKSSEFSTALKAKITAITAANPANLKTNIYQKKVAIRRAALKLIQAKFKKAQAYTKARKKAINSYFNAKKGQEGDYLKKTVASLKETYNTRPYVGGTDPRPIFASTAALMTFVKKIALAQRGGYMESMKNEHTNITLFNWSNEQAANYGNASWDIIPNAVFSTESPGSWVNANIVDPLKASINQALANPDTRSSVLKDTQGTETTTYSEEGRTNESANNATNKSFVKPLLAKLNKNEPVYIALTGYTSLDGAQNVNRSLGQRRAAAKRQAILTLLRQAPPDGIGQAKVAQFIREKKIRFTMRHSNRDVSSTTGITPDDIMKIKSENSTPNARMNAMVTHFLKGNKAFSRITGGQVISAYNRYSQLLRNPKTANQAAIYLASKPYFQGSLGQNLVKFLRKNVARSRGAGMESVSAEKFKLRDAMRRIGVPRFPSYMSAAGPTPKGDDKLQYVLSTPGTGKLSVVTVNLSDGSIAANGVRGYAGLLGDNYDFNRDNLTNIGSKMNLFTRDYAKNFEANMKTKPIAAQIGSVNKGRTFKFQKKGNLVEVKTSANYPGVLVRWDSLKFQTSSPAALAKTLVAKAKRVPASTLNPYVKKFLKSVEITGVTISNTKIDQQGFIVTKLKKGTKTFDFKYLNKSNLKLGAGFVSQNALLAEINGSTAAPNQAVAAASKKPPVAPASAPSYSPKLLTLLGRVEGSLKSQCQRFGCKFTKMENGRYAISKTVNRSTVALGEIKISSRGGVTVQYYASGGHGARTISLRRFSPSRVVKSLSNRA